jgi:nucleoside-diphosphate-sugar epimerase
MATPLRIAVTGGAGRIGRAVVDRLLLRGHQVLVLDRLKPPSSAARWAHVDLRRRELVQPLLEQVDAVCHLGEIPNMIPSYNADEIFAANTAATSVVIQSAADLGLKRLVYASSIQLYGFQGSASAQPRQLPIDEHTAANPQQAYALSKVAGEAYCRLIADHQGLSIAALRLPGMVDWTADTIPWASLERERSFHELGAYAHVTDAAEAFALAVEDTRPGLSIYNTTAPDALALRPVREALAFTWPQLSLPADWPAQRCPLISERIRTELGWTPAWSITDQYRARFGGEPRPLSP